MRLFSAFAMISFLIPIGVHGDSWAPPRNSIYGSGPYGVKVLLEKEGGSRLRAFSLDESGGEKLRWERPLDFIPSGVHVSNRGWVVTRDQYGHLGFEHSLVIFDPSGERIADYSLEDLLTADEITKFTHRTSSSRFWNAQFDFHHDGYQGTFDWLVLSLRPQYFAKKDDPERVITLDLRSGKIWPGFNPDRDNYHQMQNQISDMRAKYGFVPAEPGVEKIKKPELSENEIRIYARENIRAIEWELAIEPDGAAIEKAKFKDVRKFQVPEKAMKALLARVTESQYRSIPDVQHGANNDPTMRSIVVETKSCRKVSTVCPSVSGIDESAFCEVWKLIEEARKQQ